MSDSFSKDKAANESRCCPNCNETVPSGFLFCGKCGAKYETPTDKVEMTGTGFQGTVIGQLIQIKPDGSRGETLIIGNGENSYGRNKETPVLLKDVLVSKNHFMIYPRAGNLYLKDLRSINGVFTRIKGPMEIRHLDLFRIGQELLQFEDYEQSSPMIKSLDDTVVLGSPNYGYWGKIKQIIGNNLEGLTYLCNKTEILIGRERGDLLFPLDGFVSGTHSKVYKEQQRFFLDDLKSSNGTFLKIKSDTEITHGSFILAGLHLFAVQIQSEGHGQ